MFVVTTSVVSESPKTAEVLPLVCSNDFSRFRIPQNRRSSSPVFNVPTSVVSGFPKTAEVLPLVCSNDFSRFRIPENRR
ncbi:hypothetical protein, partial [Oscillatoria sp. HE19RPO]|uniref:hypothetical protein n=1 Tax=Oscillatoria sp. HE19RPO TaxID=2954806 RepID=UPI0020C3D7B4